MRKLAWAAFSFAASILMCHYLIPDSMRLWLIALFALLAICACMLRGKMRTRILLICVCSILGIVRYDVHARENLNLEIPLQGNDYRITAYVAEFPIIYDDYSRVTVHLRSDKLPRVKMVLYDYDDQVNLLEPGDMIRTTVKFSSASRSSGEETDTYISKGIYLRGSIKDDVLQYDTWWGRILYFPLYLARGIQSVFDTYVSEQAAVFMKALVTGEKTSLYESPEIYHTLQKAGISHVVAVSGMHISFLVGMIMILFGNRTGWIASVLSLGVFAIMTGMSPSVLRAAFMQVLYLLAPVLRRESDGITSIGFALFILLMINPFAVASVSLQLSFAAIMGIVLVTPKALAWFLEKGKSLKGIVFKVYFFVASSLASTLGASLFTVPLCAVHFGSISVLAPIANLFILWIVPCCFALGFALCVLSMVSANIAVTIGIVLSGMVEFIYVTAGIIANIPYSTVYLPTNIVLFWVICVYSVIALTYLLKRDKLYRPLVPFCFTVALLLLLVTGIKHSYENGTTVAAIDVGQGQCIAILDEEETILVDCGGAYDAGQRVVKWLSERGRNHVDCVILTHFDEDHTNGMIDLLTQVAVDEIIYCTLNLSESESAILREIQEYAGKYHTTCTITNRTNSIKQGNIEVKLFVPAKPKDNNGLMVLGSINGFDILVTGDANMSAEKEMIRKMMLPDGECLVAGHHGSKYSTSEELIARFDPEFSFISCGYNQYGHPTDEVLDRLEKRNVVIYRTDILGSVEIKVR